MRPLVPEDNHAGICHVMSQLCILRLKHLQNLPGNYTVRLFGLYAASSLMWHLRATQNREDIPCSQNPQASETER